MRISQFSASFRNDTMTQLSEGQVLLGFMSQVLEFELKISGKILLVRFVGMRSESSSWRKVKVNPASTLENGANRITLQWVLFLVLQFLHITNNQELIQLWFGSSRKCSSSSQVALPVKPAAKSLPAQPFACCYQGVPACSSEATMEHIKKLSSPLS